MSWGGEVIGSPYWRGTLGTKRKCPLCQCLQISSKKGREKPHTHCVMQTFSFKNMKSSLVQFGEFTPLVPYVLALDSQNP